MAPKVAAVVLAAGASSRLGRPKQLVVLDGEPLLVRAARTAREAGCDAVLVVLGANQDAIAEAVRAHPAWPLEEIVLVDNPGWREGMASSIRRGAERLETPELAYVQGCLILTCDQPLIPAAHLWALAARAAGEITASAYAGRHGVPAYFPRAAFAGLRALSADTGARELLKTARAIVCEQASFDVDTDSDVEQAERHLGIGSSV